MVRYHSILSKLHCLAWVTALAFLCSSSNILTSSLTMSFLLGPLWRIPFGSCYSAQLDWFEWRLWCLIRRRHSASWAALTANHFVADYISGYAFRMISSAESFIMMWRRTLPILNFSPSEDIGSCRFPELVYKPTLKNKEELRATYAGIVAILLNPFNARYRNLVHMKGPQKSG